MATVSELKDALKESLDRTGALKSLRAEVRAEVFNALDDKSGFVRPQLSDENLLINELIREYLRFNSYRSTLSVLIPESGQPEAPPFDRSFLAERLGVPEDARSKKLPLLYALLAQRGAPPKDGR